MKNFTVILFLLIAACSSAVGQVSHGYGFVGGANLGNAFRLGIGGQTPIAPQVGVGGEVGGVFGNSNGVLGSGHLSVHIPLPKSAREWDPFVLGGVAVGYVGSEGGLWAMVGGGVNYWFRRNLALRIEGRGYPGGVDLKSFGEFRVGISFR